MQILRLQNILTSFDDFDGNDLLTERARQRLHQHLPALYATSSPAIATVTRKTINDDVVFEIELVKQVEINVDYILMLVEKLRAEKGDGDDKEIRAEITRAVDKFDALVNDISIGLPAELDARRKQYDHYRDRLLTFKELAS